jgi:AAA-like domain
MRSLELPIWFVYGNCVCGEGPDDAWAGFAITTSSYAWLSQQQKRARMLDLLAAIEALEADVQILRVTRLVRAAGEQRLSGPQAVDIKASALSAYESAEARRLQELGCSTPQLYLFASLRDPERDVASHLSSLLESSPRDWLRTFRSTASSRNRMLLSADRLERLRVRADRVHDRLASYLSVRPARGVELQWLVRRSFCRGLGEPQVEGLHEPRALAFERNGQAVLAPLQADVLRWMNSVVERRGRSLRIESELGESWQAHLVLGALPETVSFPGAGAELMFAPVESLPFGVDLSLNARFLPNELALRIARRRIQDADQIARAEADGDQGISDLGQLRSEQARDLLSYLQASSKPPLLRSSLAIAVGAAEEERLEERVEATRRAYGEIRLHRPLGEQLQLLFQHLPGQRTRVLGYEDTLTAEQAAAMMPTAAHLAGSRGGFHLGRTLTGSARPIAFNLREGSDSDRNATILSVGALGSGKTTLDQKLKYEAFLLGARVIDCDPKGDHRFHLLEQVAPHVECLALRPDKSLRGMLDPLRVAPEHLRHDAAVSFLRDLLPAGAAPTWETAVLAAVDAVMRASLSPTCLEVVRALQAGDEVDREVAKTLEIYARSGLTQLAFADPRVRLPKVGAAQVTYLPIRDLPSPEPGTPRSEHSQAERVGQQIVRLIAMFAMHSMASERQRLKVFSFDEGWRLLGDPVGRSLLVALQRMGRSELAVPIISTQLVSDTLLGERSSLENLVGATFAFGMRSEAEAGRALSLLGLDPEDPRGRAALLSFDSGRCLFRDHRGRVEAIQVELVVPELLRAFSTTPQTA